MIVQSRDDGETADHFGHEILAIEIADNHVHLFVQCDAKRGPADIARQFKRTPSSTCWRKLALEDCLNEFGILRTVRNVNLERLCADVSLFDEMPVGLGHFVRIEERLVSPVGGPVTNS